MPSPCSASRGCAQHPAALGHRWLQTMAHVCHGRCRRTQPLTGATARPPRSTALAKPAALPQPQPGWMVSFRAHGHRHWYQSLTATAAAGSFNPLGTVRDQHGEASSACVESPCISTAAQQDTAGMPRGVRGDPHPPWTPFPQHVRSLCTPTCSLGSMDPRRDTPCTASCLCIQPSHQGSALWELQETLLSPSSG